MQTFPNYSEAKAAGDRIVREIAQGSQAAGLIHAHDKGLATKADAGNWFKVLPAKFAKELS
jgi:hypothetical protein